MANEYRHGNTPKHASDIINRVLNASADAIMVSGSVSADGTFPISAANTLSAFITNSLSANIYNALSAQITNALSAQLTNRPYTLPVGSGFVTTDASSTTSPINVTSGAASGIYPQANAVSITLYSTCDVCISESSGMTSYFVLPSGVTMPLDVYGSSDVWLKADGASGYTSFIIYR